MRPTAPQQTNSSLSLGSKNVCVVCVCAKRRKVGYLACVKIPINLFFQLISTTNSNTSQSTSFRRTTNRIHSIFRCAAPGFFSRVFSYLTCIVLFHFGRISRLARGFILLANLHFVLFGHSICSSLAQILFYWKGKTKRTPNNTCSVDNLLATVERCNCLRRSVSVE